ncbi:MAG: heme exporter protein CcmB [Armatimonadota bacterium]|nr:heme exporter protein CcmB [Armatimonadota bacterium]
MSKRNYISETGCCGWAARASAIALKDLKSELRTRYALNAMGIFALTTLTVVSFALGPHSLGSRALAALLWVVIFFSAIASLARAFLHEEEGHTAIALRLAADPAHVYLGKLFFNLLLLLALNVLLVPLFVGMMQARVGNPVLFVLVLLLGNAALASACTATAAIISKAGARSALFGGLAFPLLLPVLMTAINATARAFDGAAYVAAWPETRLLVSFTAVMVTASLLLFDFVWND